MKKIKELPGISILFSVSLIFVLIFSCSTIQSPEIDANADLVDENSVSDTDNSSSASDNTVPVKQELPSKQKFYEKGIEYMKDGRFKLAIQQFDGAFKIDSGFTDAADKIGEAYAELDNYTDAKTWFEKSISINKNNVVPYLGLGEMELQKKNYQEALTLYSKIIELEPANPDGYFGLGKCYFQVNLFDESLSRMDTAITIYIQTNSPNTMEAYYIQGLNYYYTGDFNSAYSYLSAIESYYNDDDILRIILSKIRAELSN